MESTPVPWSPLDSTPVLETMWRRRNPGGPSALGPARPALRGLKLGSIGGLTLDSEPGLYAVTLKLIPVMVAPGSRR
jgi:hypothetical protein